MRVQHGDIYVLRNPVVDGKAVPGVLQRLVDYNDRILREGTEEEKRTLIPVRYAIQIARFVRKANNEIVFLEEQIRGLWRKYGTEQDGQILMPAGENQKLFAQEHNELMGMETDMDVDRKIEIPDNVILSVGDLVLLDPFIEVVSI